jgi:hypothetical protein
MVNLRSRPSIVFSILAHSSTDILVARAFDQPESAPNSGPG